MAKKVGYIQLYNAIKKRLETTEYPVVEVVDKRQESPFIFIDFDGRRDDSTKAYWREVVSVTIHAIAEPSDSQEQVFAMIQAVEEAMSEDIDLGECVTIAHQATNSFFNLQQDPTDEWHGMIGFDIKIIYGMKRKI